MTLDVGVLVPTSLEPDVAAVPLPLPHPPFPVLFLTL